MIMEERKWIKKIEAQNVSVWHLLTHKQDSAPCLPMDNTKKQSSIIATLNKSVRILEGKVNEDCKETGKHSDARVQGQEDTIMSSFWAQHHVTLSACRMNTCRHSAYHIPDIGIRSIVICWHEGNTSQNQANTVTTKANGGKRWLPWTHIAHDLYLDTLKTIWCTDSEIFVMR